VGVRVCGCVRVGVCVCVGVRTVHRQICTSSWLDAHVYGCMLFAAAAAARKRA